MTEKKVTIYEKPILTTQEKIEVLKNKAELETENSLSDVYSKDDINLMIDVLSSKYGQNPEIVKRIIQCQSSFNPDAVNYNAKVGKDIGLMQINTYFHTAGSTNLGLDIYKPYDNIEYGMVLMKESGLQPWTWSEHCWKK